MKYNDDFIFSCGNIYHDYQILGKFSPYKNLFYKNVNVTICPKITIDEINMFLDKRYNQLKYKFENDILEINIQLNDKLLKWFDFYGWEKIDHNLLKPKYDIIDPNKWIKEHNDIGKKETMYFNNSNIDSYWDLWQRKGELNINTNILYDYCMYDDETIFKDLFDKDISIDALSTIEQVRYYYPETIYNYDGQYINIRRTRMNEWHKLLETIFKFYGWYPNDDRTLYPKYEILDLNKYVKDRS